MISRKIIASILCTAILITLIAGCAAPAPIASEEAAPAETQAANEDVRDENIQQEIPAPEQTDNDAALNQRVDFDAAFATFSPDTVMFTVDEFSVTWAEMFFLIAGNIRSFMSRFRGLPDLSHAMPDGRTYAETIMDFVVENSLQFRALERGATLLDVSLHIGEQDMLELNVQSGILTAGSEENFLDLLWENSTLYGLELFRYLIYVEYLPIAIRNKAFGEGGSGLSDEDMQAHFADDGLLMAKHILRRRTGDEFGYARIKIEELYKQLQNHIGDDFEAFFDKLMFEYSEDDVGLSAFPNGYLFQDGDMEHTFHYAAHALEIGEISEIIETLAGYHIILRLPINFDATPIRSAMSQHPSSLRLTAANDIFDAMLATWRDSLTPIFTEEFESIDLKEMFREAD